MEFDYIRISQLLETKKISTISPSLKLKTDDIKSDGNTAVVSQDQDFIIGYTDLIDQKLVNYPYVVFGDHTEILKYIDFPFAQGADGIKIFKTDEKYIDSKFFYYSLKSCYYPTGFYQRHYKLLKKTYIPNLSLNYQKRLALVLNNYDRLIENNEKRITILEEMAKSLYREWFVRFRFPGHEKTQFVDSLPTNFRIKRIDDLVTLYRGKSYSSADIAEGNMTLLSMNNIRPFGGFLRDFSRPYNGDYKEIHVLHDGDLIMCITDMTQERRVIGYVGLVTPCDKKMIACTHLIKLVPHKIDTLFLYSMFTFSSLSRDISMRSTGTNVLGLTADIIKKVKVLVPEQPLIDMYVEKVKPIFDSIKKLQLANENLAKQRDFLLPRLISGSVSIEGKEIV